LGARVAASEKMLGIKKMFHIVYHHVHTHVKSSPVESVESLGR